MSKHILILDDDPDFNNLLTNIFAKAKYQTSSCHNTGDALKVLETTSIDLIVTDHRMPQITGVEFTRLMREKTPNLPIIMVSGFLSPEGIRELINMNINGLFLKPLNVFSLLERTRQIFAEMSNSDDPEKLEPSNSSQLGFPFKTFPGKDPKTLKLANLLYYHRNFANNLILIGEKGSPFNSLIEDIHNFPENKSQPFLFIQPSMLNEEALKKLIASAGKEQKAITLIFPEISSLSKDNLTSFSKLLKNQTAWLSNGPHLRLIFCLNESPDILLNKNIIDDNLYLLIGTTEIPIPLLRESTQDIPQLAQEFCAEYSKKNALSTITPIEASAKTHLQYQEWPGNYDQLRDVIFTAASQTQGNPITEEILLEAVAGSIAERKHWLKRALEKTAQDYGCAAYILNGKSTRKTLELLSTDEAVLQTLLQPLNS